MVIARDRRSGVSRSILGGFTLRPKRPQPAPNAHLDATGTRSSKAAYALRQAGTFAAGGNGQPKCAPGAEMPTTGGVAAAFETQERARIRLHQRPTWRDFVGPPLRAVNGPLRTASARHPGSAMKAHG